MIRLTNILVASLLVLTTVTSCCHFNIHDDLSGCPGGIYVKYYQYNPCSGDTTAIADVSGIHLLAFSRDQKLIGMINEPVQTVDRKYQSYMPLPEGDYTLIAWMGLGSDLYHITPLKIGETTMTDLLLSLRQQNGQAASINSHRLYYGRQGELHRPAAGSVGSTDVYTSIQMRELTYRVKVEVEIHESVIGKIAPEDMAVEVTSADGEMTIDGQIKRGSAILTYPPVYRATKSVAIADVTTLDLKPGYNNMLRIVNKQTGDEIWSGDLIGSILLKNPNLSLDCKHDFTIRFVIKDKCLDCRTYFCFAIYVDGWQIHSYETELGK